MKACFQLMFHYTHLIESIARNIYRHFFYNFLTKKKKAMIRKKQNIVPVRQVKDFRSSGRNIVVIRMSRNTEAQISAESTTVNITGKLQGRTGMSRQNPPSWTVVKRLTGSWRSFRMDMALSDVRIICRVRTTFMFLLPRSAALI